MDRPLRGNCHSLQSIHHLLNVPPVATVKLVNAYQFEKFGTGNSLLRYGIRIRCSKQASLVRKGYSVPETASYGTELALGAQNSLLRYATHFLKHSVLKTGFSGTAGIFGTGNTLLRYGMKRPNAAIAWIALIRGCEDATIA